MSSITEDVKKVVLAGVGAAAMTVEKAQEVVGECIKKGEAVVSEGKAANEELKHKIKSKVKGSDKKADEAESEEDIVDVEAEDVTEEERNDVQKELDADKKVSVTAENLLKNIEVSSGESSQEVYLDVPKMWKHSKVDRDPGSEDKGNLLHWRIKEQS